MPKYNPVCRKTAFVLKWHVKYFSNYFDNCKLWWSEQSNNNWDLLFSCATSWKKKTHQGSHQVDSSLALDKNKIRISKYFSEPWRAGARAASFFVLPLWLGTALWWVRWLTWHLKFCRQERFFGAKGKIQNDLYLLKWPKISCMWTCATSTRTIASESQARSRFAPTHVWLRQKYI